MQGQLCDGFSLAKKTKSDTQSGKLWVSVASHLLIEADMVESKAEGSGKPGIDSTKLMMSNYNDPRLKIPTI